MANWLQKISAVSQQAKKAGSLPALVLGNKNLPSSAPKNRPQPPQNLPNATIIYGIGASLLFAASFSLLVSGRWFASLGVFALGAALTGFALHLLKHQD